MGRRKRMPFRATLPLVLAACYIAREISDTFVPAPQVAARAVDAVVWAHLRLAFFVAAPLSSVGFCVQWDSKPPGIKPPISL